MTSERVECLFRAHRIFRAPAFQAAWACRLGFSSLSASKMTALFCAIFKDSSTFVRTSGGKPFNVSSSFARAFNGAGSPYSGVVESRRGLLSAGSRSSTAPVTRRRFQAKPTCRREPAQFLSNQVRTFSLSPVHCESPRECSVKDQYGCKCADLMPYVAAKKNKMLARR